MWFGFSSRAQLEKGVPRTMDGKFATVDKDSGIGHKGDGFLDLSDLHFDQRPCDESFMPAYGPAGTAFDSIQIPLQSPEGDL